MLPRTENLVAYEGAATSSKGVVEVTRIRIDATQRLKYAALQQTVYHYTEA